MAKEQRTRNWNILVYPDSAPSNWREIIDSEHIQWCCMLHDKDFNDKGEKELKKAHYHVILAFDGVKSFDQVKELCDKLNAPIPTRCASLKGSTEYLWHKNNPEKYQYNRDDVECHGGFDLASVCDMTVTEKKQLQKEIITFLKESGILEFKDLIDYCVDNEKWDWFDVAMNYCTFSIKTYCDSSRYSLKGTKNEN